MIWTSRRAGVLLHVIANCGTSQRIIDHEQIEHACDEGVDPSEVPAFVSVPLEDVQFLLRWRHHVFADQWQADAAVVRQVAGQGFAEEILCGSRPGCDTNPELPQKLRTVGQRFRNTAEVLAQQ